MALPMRLSEQFDPMELMRTDFGNMLNRYFGLREAEDISPYGVDIRQDNDHIYVDAEVPGFNKDQIDISLENQVLTISATKRESQPQGKQGEQQKQPENFLLRERRCERFVRSFTLPEEVDEQTVQAKLENGVLQITLNKKPEHKPKKIPVS